MPKSTPAAGPVAGDAPVNRYLGAYVTGVANRLASGASAYYRKTFNLGMSEWRTMMAIGRSSHRIVREIAEQADIDYAAASKSLRVLEQRGLVAIEQTSRRGRAALASLTPEGLALYRQLLVASRQRQKRMFSVFSAEEVEQFRSLMQRLEAQVRKVNADG